MVTSRTQGMAPGADALLQRVGDALVGAETAAQRPFGFGPRHGNVVGEAGIDIEPSPEAPPAARPEPAPRRHDEQVDGVVAAGLRVVRVDLRQRRRQRHAVVARLVAAQPRADDDHQVATRVDLLGFRRHVEGAEICRRARGRRRGHWWR